MRKTFFSMTLMLLVSGLGYANNLPPLASFTNDVNRDFFFAGETVTFDGSGSIDQDESGSSITYYRWRVDGVIVYQGSSASQFTTSFSLTSGQNSKTVQVRLEVRDDEFTWTTTETRMTKTYTIRRGQDRQFYLKDHLGSVRVTVDEEGEPIGYDDYYPFGLQMPTRSGNTSNPNDAYKYTGHERDTEAGLTFDYMGARTYDPLLSAFLQIDPKARDLPSSSPYVYTLNNPVSLYDPDGQYPWPVHIRSFISARSVAGGLFRGDGRIASTANYPDVTSRVRSTFTVDPSQGTISNTSTVSDFTMFRGVGSQILPIVGTGTPTGSVDLLSNGNGTLSLGFSHSGKDPLTPQSVTPDLNVFGGLTLTEDLKNGVLSIEGLFTGTSFPSTEAFIVDQSGNTKIFLGAIKEKGGILDLIGSGKNNSLFRVNMNIKFDDKGNFTGVTQNGIDYSVEEWNQRVQEGFNYD